MSRLERATVSAVTESRDHALSESTAMPVTDLPAARLALDDIVTGIREIHDHTVQAAATVRADAIRREENLQACLQDALDKAGRDQRRDAERIALLTGDNEHLRTENTALQTAVDNRTRRRLRRRH